MGSAQGKTAANVSQARRKSHYYYEDEAVKEEEIPNFKLLVPVEAHYYGLGKPNSPTGEDFGIQEVWKSWDFPQSKGSRIIVLPRWVNNVGNHADYWSLKELDLKYDTQIAQSGMSEEDFTAIIKRLNRILNTFYPYQVNQSLAGITAKGSTGKNIRTDCHNFEYMLEIRRVLAQATKRFPCIRWTVHVYKIRNEGSDERRFTDYMYHSLQIDLKPPISTAQKADEESAATALPDSPKAKISCELMDM